MANLAEAYAQKRSGQQVKASSLKAGVTGGLGARTPIATTPIKARPGVVENVINKAKAIGGQTLNIAGRGVSASGKFVVNRAVDVVKSAGLTAKTFADSKSQPVDLARINMQRDFLEKSQKQIVDQYKSGKMSKENYKEALLKLSEAFQGVSKDAEKIHKGPTPSERAMALVDTATNALSLGGLTLAKAGVKTAVKKELTSKTNILAANATKQLENTILKVPAVAPLVERNAARIVSREAQKLAGETTAQYLGREGKNIAVGLLIKNPIFYQTNIGGTQEVYNDLMEGKYSDAVKGSVWLATQMLRGGPLGAAAQGFKWLGKTGGKLAYGTGSYIDEVSKNIGNGKSNQIAEYLEGLPKKSDAFKRAERVLRITQETNLRMANENAKEAAERTLIHWSDAGIDLQNVTPEKVVDLLDNWATANEKLNILGKSGKLGQYIQKNLDKHVVVRWDVDARNALAQKLEQAGDNPQAIVTAYTQWRNAVGNAAANNRILTRKIESIMEGVLNPGGSGKVGDIAEEIRRISAVSVLPKGIPSQYRKQFEKLGFTIAQPHNANIKNVTPNVAYDDTRKLVTAAMKGDTDIFTTGTAPMPAVKAIASMFEKAGLSPQATTKLAQSKLSQEVAANLQKTQAARDIGLVTGNFDEGGKAILSKLQNYMDNMKPSKIPNYLLVAGKAPGPAATDIRQLHYSEIAEALGVSKSAAKQVQSAIMKGYFDTALEYRGLGDKIVDTLYAVNPLQKYYSRIQSALRYTYNPFFRFQEKVETSILSRAQARTILWKKSKQELDDIALKLDNSGLFKTGLSGEAAQDLTLGRVTATITQAQKRNIAGLANKIAEARGVSVEELIRNYGDEVGDALRVVVQYPNKGVLNSALARTLNIAFFPMRYNTKVTALAAEILSKEPPSVQLAVINSIFDMKDWLRSDEGIRWRRDHADALALLEWATPMNSINYWFKLFSGDAKLADLGSLGGLPLGVITQALDSQGVIKLNNPYVSPTTGDVLPKYIPETAKARASVALTDLIGSMFTYPGRILGLPGKGQSLNKLSQDLTGAEGIDFSKEIDESRLTEAQRNYIRVLKGDADEDTIDSLYYSPAPGQYQGYTIPPLALPIKNTGLPKPNVERRTNLPKKASKKKGRGKKEKPIPVPIPQR